MQTTVGWVINKFKANGNCTVDFGTPEWREIARSLALAELESLKRTAERDEGDFSDEPQNPLLAQTPSKNTSNDALASRAINSDSQKSLSELLPTYMKERGAKGRSDYDSTVTVRMLEEFLLASPELACPAPYKTNYVDIPIILLAQRTFTRLPSTQ